jgi:PAS domain S-box-containing protein
MKIDGVDQIPRAGAENAPLGGPGVDAGFLAALDASPSPMWLSNPDYEGTYFNRAWLEFRGRSLAEEIGGGWITGIHRDDLPALDGYADALAAGRPFQVEYRLQRHDGAWRWMLDSAAPRRDPEGRLVGFIGSCVDITDRREMEETLRHSEARLQQAQEAAALGVYDWDIIGGRIDWSPQMYRLYGLDPASETCSDPLGLIAAWAGRLHPDDRPRCERELRQSIEGDAEQLAMAFRAIHPEQGLRWIEGRGRIMRDARGRALRLTGVNFDVTERHAREAARERSAMMLGMSVEVAAIGTWEYDPDTRQVTASARTDALFGLTHLGGPRPLRDYVERVHPEDRDALQISLTGPIADGEETSRLYRLLREDGPPVWVSTRGRMVRLSDGSRRLIGAMTDVTAAQQKAAAREAALEHRQTLLAELNHRMKNNLHLILSMLRLEANRAERPEGIVAATERIEAVADLHAQLGFDEEAGRVGFAAYLEDLAARLRRSVLQGTRIELDCRVEPVELELDMAVPLGLVVNELITNAIKYAFPEGRGRIGVTLRRAKDGSVLVTVEDDGHGPGETREAPSSGLGSRLVAGLCAQIGATIDSRSLPGMRHEIRLPPQR